MKLQTVYFIGLFICALLALFSTHAATYQSSDFFEGLFLWIFYADIALIVIMLATVLIMAWRLWRAWRQREKGARLSLRLTLLFLAFSLLPSVALYSISAAGIFRSIESWFDTPLNRAFEKGIEFGQDVLGREFARLEFTAGDIGRALSTRRGGLPFWIDDVRLFHQLEEVTLYDADGNVLFSSGDNDVQPRLSANVMRQVADKKLYFNVVGDGIERHIEAIITLPRRSPNGFALKIARLLPVELSSGLSDIEQGHREYEKLLVLRKGLRLSFFISLTLSLVLILLLVSWLSLRLGRNLTAPLVNLATTAAAVGAGDFSRRLREKNRIREISELNRSFNRMVNDLQQSRGITQKQQEELSKANVYLENLLSSLTTGVLTFSAEGLLLRYNAAAEQIFQLPLKDWLGRHINDIKSRAPLPAEIGAILARLTADETIEKPLQNASGGTVLIRVTALSASAGGGILLVADDITRQIRAEREATWEEASRRFVHEIKNPLTPVQLAAERLRHKLLNKLAVADANMLDRLVDTIVNQVDAMREMVDNFRDYANERRFSAVAVDFNALLREIAQLYEAEHNVRLQVDLSGDMPAVAGESVALRQLLHNLLGNAADAAGTRQPPTLWLATKKWDDDFMQFTIEDNGGGVDDNLLQKMGQPYVTTKEHGTGLGLAVVRKTVDEHGGVMFMDNGDNGLRVRIRLPFYRDGDAK